MHVNTSWCRCHSIYLKISHFTDDLSFSLMNGCFPILLHPKGFCTSLGLVYFEQIIVTLETQGSLILVLNMVEHVVSVGLCGLECLMAVLCGSFVVVLNGSILVYTHSLLIPWEKVTGSLCFISSAPLIIVYTHAHTHINKHSFIVSSLCWAISVALSYSFQCLLTIKLFTVVIASPFLVRVTWEGCLGWDTGLALDTWFPSSTG